MIYYFNGWVLYSFIILFFVLVTILKFVFNKSYTYLFFFTIMYIYLCNVINLTQFPIYNDPLQKELIGQNVWQDMSLIPFETGFSKAYFLNILMTVPLGFGLPFLMKSSFKKTFIIGISVGIIFEATQLVVALFIGYTFRYVTIDDIICNTVGALIGYLLFKLFKLAFQFFVKKFKIGSNQIIEHILSIKA